LENASILIKILLNYGAKSEFFANLEKGTFL